MISVFIADDSEHVRRAVSNFFAGDSRFLVVGEASNYDDTLRLISELKPDIVVSDVPVPGGKADEAGLEKLVSGCECLVIAMSSAVETDTRTAAARVGAACRVDKARLYDELIPAIERLIARCP